MLSRFLRIKLGSLFWTMYDRCRTWRMSYLSIKLLAGEWKTLYSRNVTLVGSQAAGGVCARLISRPSNWTVGGNFRARSSSQMLGWEVNTRYNVFSLVVVKPTQCLWPRLRSPSPFVSNRHWDVTNYFRNWRPKGSVGDWACIKTLDLGCKSTTWIGLTES